MSGLQIGILVGLAINAVSIVASIGKERKPITPGVAAMSIAILIVIAFIVAVLG